MRRFPTAWVFSLLCAGFVRIASAGDLAIQSLDGTGRLDFTALNNGTTYSYRVEWAPAPTGPWTNFTSAAALLDTVAATGGQVVACSVPMCYRVIATAQGIKPSVTTSNATGYLFGGSATLSGAANPNGTSATGWFRYSTVNPGTPNDTSGTRLPASGGTALGAGSSPVPFSQTTGGLTGPTVYYFWAISSNAAGVAYGSISNFITPPPF